MAQRTKLLIISPHFSTGGAPQVTLNKVELLNDYCDIMVVEYDFIAWNFVVQRNKVINLIGNNFKSLGENKYELLDFIEAFDPDTVSMEEFPEMFMDDSLTRLIYSEDRTYKIVETTHDSSFDTKHKRWMPDEFMFVSAYSMLKYSHLNIPMKVVEYPVNLKDYKRDRKADSVINVCIVGLWTPRKNQAYAIDIARQLVGYNIKFHFLGNQADNFRFYWEPLMKDLPEYCIVHGEVDDVPAFIKQCDVFLFTSKGDRNNKELNPIAIKEAMEYVNMPKFLFNLDVYLNKYNNEDIVKYLCGDLETDVNLIKNTLDLKMNRKELVVIGTYPNTEIRERLTEKCVDTHRALERDILLVSHYPVSTKIQKMVDFYIYDEHNPLLDHSYYNRFQSTDANGTVTMRIGIGDNQSLTVLTNLINAAKFAKAHGYTHFFYNTFDVLLDKEDIDTVNNCFRKMDHEWKACLATLNTDFGKGIQTNGMFLDVNIVDKLLDDVRDGDEFNQACQTIGAHNFLEDYLMKRVDRTEGLWIEHPQEDTFLKHSGVGVSSNSEYYGVLEEVDSSDKYFYFNTFNVLEDREFIVEQGEDLHILNMKKSKVHFIKLNDHNKLSIGWTFNNLKEIDLTPIGTYKKSKQRPKIKLVHIQTTINDEREQKSRESLERVKDYGWEYILHRNDPYRSLPPKHNCFRPNCVSMELFDEETTNRLGTALTPAHYGCYEAFKNAILSEFHGCDYLMICEGDCLIEDDIEYFMSCVESCASVLDKYDIDIMSFGDKDTLEFGWPQSPVIEEVNSEMYITNHIIGLQCIMFPARVADRLKEVVRIAEWDAADMYFNQIFSNSKMGIVYNRLTTQADGYSLIDQQHKTFRK